MNCVSVVFTVHVEMELLNVSELRAILGRIRPEVIFLEVPPSAFHDYYENCSRVNLESSAVRRYRESNQVELVPVDLPTPGEDFFTNFEDLCRRIGEQSFEFRRLMDWDSACMRRYGFAYLNSEDCSALWSDVYQEMLSTIKRMDDSSLVKAYGLWNKTNDLREREMVKNIQKYCGENTFDKSVFLVGAAHRRHIIELTRQQSAVDSTRICWDFAGR